MANRKKYDAIVVGAGPGGCTCAGLLAKKGLHVLLLDKNRRVGGKQMSAWVKGYKGELWPTGGLPVTGGAWLEAFRALGIESKFRVVLKDMCMMFLHNGNWMRAITRMDPYEMDPNALFDQWGMNKKEKEEGIQILTEFALRPPDKIDSLDDITVKEWCEQYGGMPRAIYEYLAFFTHGVNVGLVDLVPMSEMIKAFQRLTNQPLGYPKGGYGRMSEDFAQVIEDCDSEIKTRTRVERILEEEGRAAGGITEDATYRSPIVVSNAGIHPTVLKLVGEQYFDKSYVSYVKSLLPSNGFTGSLYILKEPVLACG